jgi:hypothetical protein
MVVATTPLPWAELAHVDRADEKQRGRTSPKKIVLDRPSRIIANSMAGCRVPE